MAFVTKEWKDRLVEFAGRRLLKNVATGDEATFDVSRAEGTVSQAGHAFSAATMNDLEERIKDGFDEVNTNLTADGTPFRFGKDSNGNYGYIIEDEAGADAVIPFRSIDYGKIYTLSKTTTSLTTGTSVSLAQALPKGKYIGGWASFWSSDGTIRAVNTGVKTGVSITKTKDTTKVEKIDGATAPIVVVDIAEDSDTITLSDVNNYYRAAAAFWVKIG